MAICRFALTHRTRKTGSASATNVVQYLTREGRYAVFPDEDVRYLTRTSEATQARGDLRHVEVGNLPAWAGGDAAVFFEAAYQGEERQARYATAIQIALPRELTHEQQIALAQDFVEVHLHDKPYLWVKHEPLARDGEPQPHIHILCSTRGMDGYVRGPEQFFKRYQAQHPEHGGARKDPFWKERRCPGKLRESWAILTNLHLERAGQEARVDPRELRAQGIERQPGNKWERSPEPRDAGQEQAAAREWWRGKRREVGLTETNLIDAVRRHARQGGPGHYPSPMTFEQRLVHIQDQLRTLEVEDRILTRALTQGSRRPMWTRQAGGAPRREERGMGGGLRVRLQEEEEYERKADVSRDMGGRV